MTHPNALEMLPVEERATVYREAAAFRVGSQRSLAKAGFDNVPEYLEAVGINMDLGATLEACEAHLRRFVVLPDPHYYVAVALWAAATHAVNAAEQSPILALMSAVRRSGKTRALDVLAPMCARPWWAIRPSEAVFFRRIDRDQPTVFLDEVDTIFNAKTEHEGIRATLNAGNRAGATIPRAVAKGKGFDLVDFKIYCAKVLAGIGQLPETVADRAIVVPMARKGPGDKVERLRSRDAIRLGEPIGKAFARALADVGDLTVPFAELPDELDDRAQDSWEPLLAIARLAGGLWPLRAREAAITVSADRGDVDDESLGIVLLRDIHAALVEPGAELSTSQLLERLWAIELSPWSDIRGRPVTGRRLAKLLRPFGIRPERDRAGSRYRWGQFTDAWARYLPQLTATSAATATNPFAAEADVADMAVIRERQRGIEDDFPASAWEVDEPDPPTMFDELMG